MKSIEQKLHGILCVDKPVGVTSAAVVGRVKRLLPRGARVGHAGTLDPFATGVLLLLVGRATKQCEALMGSPKQYVATVKLGATTASDDTESPEQPLPNAAPVAQAELLAAIARQIGAVEQMPPVYSALKVGGKRACDRVRAGQSVVLQPRIVQIYGIELLDYAWPLVRLKIDCGRGTYVRAIARDIGQSLGVGGYLIELRRTRVGDFDVAESLAPETMTPESLVERLEGIDRA